ncbi:hypothetical protein ACLOJK_004407, partial [Asimina triloba]
SSILDTAATLHPHPWAKCKEPSIKFVPQQGSVSSIEQGTVQWGSSYVRDQQWT